MKKIEKGFTLIEMLSVIVILGVTFMFILPSITELFTMGNKTEIELIEENVLRAAKEYVNNVDGTFYKRFYKEGDVNYIYKSDLINAGMITEEEISKLDTFAGVKGELLANDRMKYTVQYINVSSDNYTNEELYNMIQDVANSNNEGSSVIEDIKDKVNKNTDAIDDVNTSISNMTNKDSNENIFLKMYPVGSIYVNSTNTNPSTMFGGEWKLVDKRFKVLEEIYSGTSGSTMVFTPTSNISEHEAAVVRIGNSIRIRFKFVNAVDFTDSSIELGTFNLNNLGIADFIYDFINFPCASDVGNGITYIVVDSTTGIVKTQDVVTKESEGTIPSSSKIYCDFTYTVYDEFMLDSAVQEFHFQRTA